MKEKTNVAGLVAKAIDACGDKESLLVIYSGKDGGNIAFTGDPNEIAVGFAYILANGVVDGATKEQRKLADSVLYGIFNVLSVGDTASELLFDVIDMIVCKAKEEVVIKREQEKSVPSEFDPHSEDCLSCEDYIDCAIRFLRDMQKKMRNDRNGGDNNGNVTKKNKKQHKHTNKNK